MGDRFFNILGGVVTIGLVTAVVSRSESANIVKAFGDAFKGSITAALGK
jgi:uncharacterized membrane protein